MSTTPDKVAFLRDLQHFMPIAIGPADISAGNVGLVLVDPVVGFTLEGALADAENMQPMVTAIEELCRDLGEHILDRLSIFVFRDHHGADQIEPPYPPHCQEGTGEELLDPKLRWLEDEAHVTVFGKDCINGMIGALVPTEGGYQHVFVDWVVENDIQSLLVVGDCTDICDLDFVVSALSARNHGLFGASRMEMPIYVYEPACATFHLEDPESLGLPLTARHDKDVTHHAALYFMQSRGAILANELIL